MEPKEYCLRHADGRFYSFLSTRRAPQFCFDCRGAKMLSKRGAAEIQRRLLERFEVVHESHLRGVS